MCPIRGEALMTIKHPRCVCGELVHTFYARPYKGTFRHKHCLPLHEQARLTLRRAWFHLAYRLVRLRRLCFPRRRW